MRYPNNHYYTSCDLFEHYDTNRIKSKEKINISKFYKKKDKKDLARGLLNEFMKIVQDHIIETGDRFQFPVPYKVLMKIDPMKDREAKQKLQRGVYSDVDILESDFKLYEFTIDSDKLKQKRYIRILKKDYDKLVENINNGKKY